MFGFYDIITALYIDIYVHTRRMLDGAKVRKPMKVRCEVQKIVLHYEGEKNDEPSKTEYVVTLRPTPPIDEIVGDITMTLGWRPDWKAGSVVVLDGLR